MSWRKRLVPILVFVCFVLFFVHAGGFYYVSLLKLLSPADLPGKWFNLLFGGLVVVPGFLIAGFFVFWLRPSDKQAVLLALVLGALGTLVLVDEPVLNPDVPFWLACVLVAARLVAAALFPSVFFHFLLIFPEGEGTRWPILRRFPRLEFCLYLPHLLIGFPNFASWMAPGLWGMAPRGAVALFSKLAPLGGLLMALYLVGGLLSLALNYREAGDLLRRKIRVAVVGSICGFLPFLLMAALYFIFGIEDVPGLWVAGVLALPLVPLSFGYVIVRHQVIPIRLIIRRGIRYLLVSRGFFLLELAVAIMVLTFLLAGNRAAALDRLGKRGDVVAGITGTLLTLGLLRGVNRRIMAVIDRRFFREAYNAQLLLSNLAEEVRRTADIHHVAGLVGSKVQEALHPENVKIFLRDGSGDYVGVFAAAHARDVRRPVDRGVFGDDGPDKIPHGGLVLNQLRGAQRPMFLDSDDDLFKSATTPSSEPPHLKIQRPGTSRPALLVPLATKEDMIGLISLGPRLGDLPFSQEDQQLLMALASQTAYAVENARLVERTVEEERLRRELELAAAVQRRLFPEEPEVPGLDLAGICLPARGVGGDYYDFLVFEDGQLAVVVADVAGKGMAAALLMSTVQAAVRSLAEAARERLTEFVSSINQLMYRSTESASYSTFFYARIDPQKRCIAYINAGHNPPLLFQRAGLDSRGTVPTVELYPLSTGGPVIGLFSESRYQQETLRLYSGDVLVAYTDGITEAMNLAGEEFGEARLREVVSTWIDLSAQDLLQEIIGEVRKWSSGAPQHDDLTLVIAKVK